MRKSVSEMTLAEIESEIEFWEDFFADCEETGQGISTKEAVRHRQLEDERDARRIDAIAERMVWEMAA